MSDIDFVKHCLERNRGQWGRVARESDVKYKTIKNLMQGKVKDPRNSTVSQLANYFRADARPA